MISEAGVPGPREPAVVGGKAASLFRLAELGFDVPAFFVLTADAYRGHPRGRLSVTARKAVTAAWMRLGGAAHTYAVRSSGVAEDGADDSFAGIFDTVLDVRGAEGVIAAIEHCWASHRSARADAYRDTRGVENDVAMAVVVQRMAAAAWAGVSFTADPVSQALSVTVVNAVRGIGEALVSGLVNPEEIKVRSADRAVLERRTPPGAEPFPPHLLDEVVRISGEVAAALQFPQDLEWAVEDGQVRLLQSRPITTVAAVFHNRLLEPWAPGVDPDSPDRMWVRAYADEIWTPPVSPLFYDLQNLTRLVSENLVRNGDPDPIPPEVFKYFRAAAYIDADLLERMYAALPPVSRRPGLVDLLPRDRQARLRKAPWRWRRAVKRTWLFEVKHGARWGLTRNHRLLARSWDGFLDRTQPLMDRDLTQLDDAALDAHLAAVFEAAGSIGPECQVAVVYHAQELKLFLSGLLDRWFGDGERLYAEVSSGLEDSHTVREAQALWVLARQVVEAGAAAKLAPLSWSMARAAALRLGLADFVTGLEGFLAQHRHRGGHYKDVIHPRWGDDPHLLWSQVTSLLHADAASPAAVNAASGARRRQAQAELLTRPQSAVRRAILRRLLALNETYASLRDNHRFYYDRIWWLLRGAFLEKGRRAHAAGRLAAPADVFHLCRMEIAALASGVLDPALAAERIRIRRQEWEDTRRTLPPKYLTAGYAPVGDAPPETGDLLTGIGASPGEATGPARVLHDISGLSEVMAGDVLVTRQTDPSWSPAFARLGGLVLETGGVLAHGASLCREYGLPCVTAAEAATSRIQDGDIVRVSGSRGVVEVIRRAAAPPPSNTRSSHGLCASR